MGWAPVSNQMSGCMSSSECLKKSFKYILQWRYYTAMKYQFNSTSHWEYYDAALCHIGKTELCCATSENVMMLPRCDVAFEKLYFLRSSVAYVAMSRHRANSCPATFSGRTASTEILQLGDARGVY